MWRARCSITWSARIGCCGGCCRRRHRCAAEASCPPQGLAAGNGAPRAKPYDRRGSWKRLFHMAALPLTVRLNPNDNVVVARVDILPGTELPGEGLAIAQRIPAGHKVATRPIAVGEPIRKFDQIIGFATQAIGVGEHVHVHNCGMREFARDYAVGQDVRPTPMVPEAERP